MIKNTLTLKIFVYLGVLYVLFPYPAHAYVDPGTGSYLFQLLIAGVVGGSFFFRSAVKRVKKFFKDSSRSHTSEDEN